MTNATDFVLHFPCTEHCGPQSTLLSKKTGCLDEKFKGPMILSEAKSPNLYMHISKYVSD